MNTVTELTDYMNFQDLLEDEEKLVRETARTFVNEQVLPIIDKHAQEESFPFHLIPQMGELGFFGPTLPEEYGCAGLSNVAYGLLMYELERGDSGLRSMASVQGSLVMYPIFAYGTEEQRKKYLPRLANGELMGCFGLTEPDHGSNPGGMVTKLEAASLATASGVPVVLASAKDVHGAVTGADVGTLFHVTGKRDTTRLQWLAHAAKVRGAFVLDDGAVKAVRGRRASLLAAGVVEVRGNFEAGEPVELLTRDGDAIARGFAGFSAEESTSMCGLSTEALREQLGEGYARELIHIDDLVVL